MGNTKELPVSGGMYIHDMKQRRESGEINVDKIPKPNIRLFINVYRNTKDGLMPGEENTHTNTLSSTRPPSTRSKHQLTGCHAPQQGLCSQSHPFYTRLCTPHNQLGHKPESFEVYLSKRPTKHAPGFHCLGSGAVGGYGFQGECT